MSHAPPEAPRPAELDLARRWRALIIDLNVRPEGPAAAIGRDLLRRYAEAHRRYHDQRHLQEVLDAVDLIAAGSEAVSTSAELRAARLAAWFHDAIYDPRAAAGSNEDASAELARQSLTALALPPSLIQAVIVLVAATATHELPAGHGERDAFAVLCDADLAILASGSTRYADYAAAVREEYAHVPDPDFRLGRAAILQTFLDRPRIYLTDPAYAAWEAPARINLAREIADLG